MIRKVFLPCILVCTLLFAGCAGSSTTLENEMKMSQVFTEDSMYIDSIEIYQNGVCEEVQVDDLSDDVKAVFKTISNKQKRMNCTDGYLFMTVEDARQYLQGVSVNDTIAIHAEGYLDMEEQYVLVELTDQYIFEVNRDYAIACDVVLLDAENKLVHWGNEGEFVGCVGYFR